MKTRKGYVYKEKNGSWYARFTYTDLSGNRRNVKRKSENKTDGEQILKNLIREFDEGGVQKIAALRLDFNYLCDFYTKNYLTEAKYVNNRKISGLRSVATVRGYIAVFRGHFGRLRLSDLTYEHLRAFRSLRLATPTHQSEQRAVATVNRELSYLRRLLNIAEQNGWISKNPFLKGDTLIHTSDEVRRERILTRDEETRLLNCCQGRRSHIRPLIIAAIDTGCRQGELFKLTWNDIDLVSGIITIRAFNTKTMRERCVSITSRLSQELQTIAVAGGDPFQRVFGINCEVRKGFRSACVSAGLDGLRFHDLRHTHATRLDELGFSLAKIGGQLGHTVVQTTLRYVNRDITAIQQVAIELDKFNVN